MPTESIRCPECGAAASTEFKSGSYVCGNCEAIFREIAPTRVGSAGASCELDHGDRICGIQAVGRCTRCSRAFCGTHQARMFGQAYVDKCAVCLADETAQRISAADQILEDIRAALIAIEDPIERVISAVGSCWEKGNDGRFRALLEALVAETWPQPASAGRDDLKRDPPWDSGEVARWFADRARLADIPTDCTASWHTYETRIFRAPARREGRPEPAWNFPEGSTLDERGPNDSYPQQDAVIFTDGRFMPGATQIWPNKYATERAGNLGAAALARMANLLNLTVQGHSQRRARPSNPGEQ